LAEDGILGFLGGGEGDPNEPEAADGAAAALDTTAATMALKVAETNPMLARKAGDYFDAQTRLVKIQSEHMHEQREMVLSNLQSASREGNLRRFGLRLRNAIQLVGVFIAIGIAAIIAVMVRDAVTSRAVIVDVFTAPPVLAGHGLTGEVIAGGVSDQLVRLQAATHSSQSARAIANSWTDDIKVEIPETGLTIGEVDRFLRSRFGHDVRISGALVQNDSGGLELTVRGTGVIAKTFTGGAGDLTKLTAQAAEYLYSQSQPALYIVYLVGAGRDTDAISAARAIFDTAPEDQRPVILNAWGAAVDDANTEPAIREALKLYRAAIALKPDYWVARFNEAGKLQGLGDEEGAWQAQQAMLREAGGRPGSARELDYTILDTLTYNLAAEHGALLADAADHAGYGSANSADGLAIADVDILLHDLPAAELRLQTTQLQPGSDLDAATLHFERGRLAQARGDTATAVREAETWGATPYAAGSSQPCWIAQVEEQAGHHDRADAALQAGGHYVDCYRFRADFTDQRGDWPAAQQQYAAAVALAPDLPASYYSWGMALARHGDLPGAITKLSAAHERGPNWADPLKAWGDVLARQGEWGAALIKYDQALTLAPKWEDLQKVRAVAAQH